MGRPAPRNAMLEVDQVSKWYGERRVLREVGLSVPQGSVLAVLGPSGCGKSTLLRVVAGLERADAGSVRFAGAAVDGLPPHRRGFGLMFQDYALFPHLDVAGNVAFGLEMAGLARAERAARVAEMLELVGMVGYGRRRIDALSGGERQRVALARALAPRPRLLMLDEPLAALDRVLRERLQQELRAILRGVGVTALYVTHDQAEAFALADEIALMREGSIVQVDRPEAIYRRPAGSWAASFLGLRNQIPAVWAEGGLAQTALGALRCRAAESGRAGSPARLLIYPDALRPATAAAPNVVEATVRETTFRGDSYRVVVAPRGGGELWFDLAAPLGPDGSVVRFSLEPEGVLALAEGEGQSAPMAAADWR